MGWENQMNRIHKCILLKEFNNKIIFCISTFVKEDIYKNYPLKKQTFICKYASVRRTMIASKKCYSALQ